MGIPTLISTNSDSTDIANIAFTSGIDSTYDEYMFVGTDLGPVSDSVNFTFNGSIDGGSNYNVVKTTTVIQAYTHGSSPALRYYSGNDLAQSAAYQLLTNGTGGDANQSCVFILNLFTPSNTTYVTHFYLRCHSDQSADYAEDYMVAGYFNVTAAINAIDFKFSSGNIEYGVIQMYGIA